MRVSDYERSIDKNKKEIEELEKCPSDHGFEVENLKSRILVLERKKRLIQALSVEANSPNLDIVFCNQKINVLDQCGFPIEVNRDNSGEYCDLPPGDVNRSNYEGKSTICPSCGGTIWYIVFSKSDLTMKDSV